ncbi:uncharacterized protein ARMOST_07447 [Armillaria ostoyae]|uniref:Uncharacterized protein n=1 Tax=Armillaria ostoyae TaxID=47428 RepID=A0A284R5U9_ARMOS|nr:uncharacterized protein ARMOST_07447 [Armillaria ostoyae]
MQRCLSDCKAAVKLRTKERRSIPLRRGLCTGGSYTISSGVLDVFETTGTVDDNHCAVYCPVIFTSRSVSLPSVRTSEAFFLDKAMRGESTFHGLSLYWTFGLTISLANVLTALRFPNLSLSMAFVSSRFITTHPMIMLLIYIPRAVDL